MTNDISIGRANVETDLQSRLTGEICNQDDVVSAARELLSRGLSTLEKTALTQPQESCPVAHHFGPNLYIREVSIPAGTFAVGHYQKSEHLNVMLKGRVLMIAENGKTVELKAPQVFVGKPGRKIGYVIEDMVWQNIYSTSETDVDELEKSYLEKSVDWLENEKIQWSLAEIACETDRKDYFSMLGEIGISPETAWEQSNNLDDQIPFPDGAWRLRIHDSPIHGKGMFATYPINPGEVIAPARIHGKRTPAGRYTNHSAKPNAVMVKRDNGDIDLIASVFIEGCKGGDRGQEITINYAQALSLSLENLPCQQ